MRPLIVPVLVLSPTFNVMVPSTSHCGEPPVAVRSVVVTLPCTTVPLVGATVVAVVLWGGVVVDVDSVLSAPNSSNGCVCDSGSVVDDVVTDVEVVWAAMVFGSLTPAAVSPSFCDSGDGAATLV